jgi:hypothetical protein
MSNIEFKIDISKMTHLKDKSHYNLNYYTHGNCGLELLQKCNEEYGTCDYYLIDRGKKIFIGSSEGTEDELINFMNMYT